MPRTRVAKKNREPLQDELSRKDELIRTGVELFSEHGFKGTSIRDIARSLGISVSNMYHYFETKEDLWLAIQEYSVRWLPVRLEAVWEQSAEPLERFRFGLQHTRRGQLVSALVQGRWRAAGRRGVRRDYQFHTLRRDR
ncbi:MAG: helix-turn-helix domain containing protein [Proteobacteria bacterium]|nr:helix-turn-helix domain containing protein [Pseudomonadota bacterium]